MVFRIVQKVPLGSDLGSVLEWRLTFLHNGAGQFVTASFRPAVASTHFHYVSPNPRQRLLLLET